MQRSLRMINVILDELEEWKDDVRLFSLKLLGQVIIHSENAISSKFTEIFPVLSKCCTDSIQSVANEVEI